MSESKLQSECVKFAASCGILTRKIHAENKRGWPDLVLIFPVTGEAVWVEMKNPNKYGSLSKLQRRECNKIMAQNASAYICDSYDDFVIIVERHLRR